MFLLHPHMRGVRHNRQWPCKKDITDLYNPKSHLQSFRLGVSLTWQLWPSLMITDEISDLAHYYWTFRYRLLDQSQSATMLVIQISISPTLRKEWWNLKSWKKRTKATFESRAPDGEYWSALRQHFWRRKTSLSPSLIIFIFVSEHCFPERTTSVVKALYSGNLLLWAGLTWTTNTD